MIPVWIFLFLIDIFALCYGFRMVFFRPQQTQDEIDDQSLDEWKTRVIFCSTNEIRAAKIQTPIWHLEVIGVDETSEMWKGWTLTEEISEQEMTSHYAMEKKCC